MAIPGFQDIMLPLLRRLGDGEIHSMSELTDALAAEFQLTAKERKERLPSGTQAVFANRVGWARTYLKKAGLVSAPGRGYVQIPGRGRDVLKSPPEKITIAYLDRFPEFRDFVGRDRAPGGGPPEDGGPGGKPPEDVDPKEALERAYQRLRAELAHDVLEAVKACPPAFFERLVVDLLVRMGYGGTRKDAGEAVGGSGDGGIDGIIKEDRLGLDVVYVQAKRWEGSVGRPEIQKFAGALQGHRARKGIFITTSQFTSEALDYASRIETRLVLSDSPTLADLMIDHGVGVAPVATYELKRLDSDYFEQLD